MKLDVSKNTFTKEDSANQTDYNPKDLIKLEELGYIDLWKLYTNEDSDRYTWYHHTGTVFRIDYAFVSSKLAATLDNVSTYQDRHI
jgi:exodeoxyribonuclease-3